MEGIKMSKTVVGLFDSHTYAENAAKKVQEQGLRTDDISIVARQAEHSENEKDKADGNKHDEKKTANDNISDGVVTGGVLGGLAGILIGAGSMVVPGLGVIAAAGPITGLLSGAVTGGVVGGLVDLGIPEKRGKEYEKDIKSGKVLFSMRTDEDKTSRISSILRDNGAVSVDVYQQ
jgi:uncharacterized membrane protein